MALRWLTASNVRLTLPLPYNGMTGSVFRSRLANERVMIGMIEPLANSTSTTISVIMPVYNADHFISQSLTPLMEMLRRGEVDEVIVADDGSTDCSASLAAEMGAQVVSGEHRSGPGAARNRAAQIAEGDVVWFVDADVVVHADAAAHVKTALANSDYVAVFGSYDDTPSAPNFASQYKNLVHHYYHQKGDRNASTFWAGCGAVRKEAFLEVGGFDVDRYSQPSIEDIELGYRLRARGQRILLDPALLGTHLKVWRFGGMIHTDIFRRAVPWARLMVNQSGLVDDLNVSKFEQLRLILAVILLLVTVVAIFGLVPWWSVPLAFVVAVLVNWDLFKFFYRRKGVPFALGALLFHQLYYLYGGVVLLLVSAGGPKLRIKDRYRSN